MVRPEAYLKLEVLCRCRLPFALPGTEGCTSCSPSHRRTQHGCWQSSWRLLVLAGRALTFRKDCLGVGVSLFIQICTVCRSPRAGQDMEIGYRDRCTHMLVQTESISPCLQSPPQQASDRHGAFHMIWHHRRSIWSSTGPLYTQPMRCSWLCLQETWKIMSSCRQAAA